MRPGDIITASNGKTIEVYLPWGYFSGYVLSDVKFIIPLIILSTFILANLQVNNTDAEGRLTLADALVYTCKQGVDKVYIHKLIFDNLFFFNSINKKGKFTD